MAAVGQLLSEDEIAEMKRKKEINEKMSAMLRQMSWQIIFLILLVFVINGNQDTNVFLQNQDLRNTFQGDLDSVRVVFTIVTRFFTIKGAPFGMAGSQEGHSFGEVSVCCDHPICAPPPSINNGSPLILWIWKCVCSSYVFCVRRNRTFFLAMSIPSVLQDEIYIFRYSHTKTFYCGLMMCCCLAYTTQRLT